MMNKIMAQVKGDLGDPLYMHTLDNPNAYSTTANDEFGFSVACSDSYVVVSATREDEASGGASGKVYIFDSATGTLLQTLDNPNDYGTVANDEFGQSVACSDSYVVVGTYLEDDAGGTTSGKAYIFNPATGSLLYTLDNPNAYDTSADDEFGQSVACSNSYVVVGAYNEDDAGGTTSGKAYIFNPATGSLLYTLDNPNAYGTSANDQFGLSVACSDSYVVVGANSEGDAGGSASGKAYIFDPADGTLLWTLDNPNAYDTAFNDLFGHSVACSDSYVVVGAYREDDIGGTDSGKAYIFDPATGTLLWTLDNPNAYGTSTNDQFGLSVACSDSYVVVGTYLEDDAGGTTSGKAYIFNPADGTLLQTLDNPNDYDTSADDRFGWAVACSNSCVVVGAYLEDDAGGTSSGKAYLYKFKNEYQHHLSTVLDNPNAYGTSGGDVFGLSVACSDSYVVVSAELEDDAGGTDSGKAYIFNPANGTLLWTLDNPNAYDTAAYDNFGYSVACSDSYVVVGAQVEGDAGGIYSGKAYIFDPADGTLLWTLDNPNDYGTSGFDVFAQSVACSNSHVVVGAYLEDDAGGLSSGKAYIFDPADGTLLYTLDNPNAYGTSANDQFGLSVACSDSYVVVGANSEGDAGGSASGKAYIFDPADGTLLWTLDNPNAYDTSADDRFGIAVACSDSYVVVGAYLEDDAGGTSSGKAYIFDPADGTLLWTLDNPNAYDTAFNDQFGESVACSDSYVVVGAYKEDEASGLGSGKAYIFNPATGTLLKTINNPNAYVAAEGDSFGYAVACSDSYVVVGAYEEDDAGGTDSGKAYIYTNTALTQIYDNPNAYGTSVSDFFGRSVASSDSYVVVSASSEDDAGGNSSGKAYIFDPADGTLLWTLDNPNAYDTSGGDFFGWSVGCSDSYVVVGAYGEDDAGGSLSGKAYIFDPADGTLLWTLDNPNAYDTSGGDYFGYSVACSDSYVVVGAHNEDDASGNSSGKAYIFDPADGTLLWTLDNPNAYDTSGGDFFGWSVGCSDLYVVVGAYLEDDLGGSASGKAYIFNPATGTLLWTLDNPNAYDTSLNDNFGFSVACSDSYVVVGAYVEDDAGGTSSGKAYIFDPATGSLLWTLDNPNAYGTSASDEFGHSVACSNSYAVVGARYEDDAGGTSSGKAYIFDPATGSLLWTLDNPNAYGTSASDEFGYSVACSDSYAVVAARLEDDAGGTFSGKAYQYNLFKEIQ